MSNPFIAAADATLDIASCVVSDSVRAGSLRLRTIRSG